MQNDIKNRKYKCYGDKIIVSLGLISNVREVFLYTAVFTKVVPQKRKAYATMSIGIMGRKSLPLLD